MYIYMYIYICIDGIGDSETNVFKKWDDFSARSYMIIHDQKLFDKTSTFVLVIVTLPETNIAREKELISIGHTSSNHQFSGANR